MATNRPGCPAVDASCTRSIHEIQREHFIMLYVMWFLLSLAAGLIGRKRQFGFWGFFLASLFLTPLVVILVLVLTYPEYRKT